MYHVVELNLDRITAALQHSSTLQSQHRPLPLCHGVFERVEGFTPPHKEGDNHVGKKDDIPQGNEGKNCPLAHVCFLHL
jgi:hypothetical protein